MTLRLKILAAMALVLAITVERAILDQDLERSFRDLQESQVAIVERERKIAALEALRAATTTLSHYINNAAAGIEGCRDVLATAMEEQADWQLRYALDGIRASVRRITLVLPALQDLTRIELTPFPGGMGAHDMEHAIQRAMAGLGPDGQRPGGDTRRHTT